MNNTEQSNEKDDSDIETVTVDVPIDEFHSNLASEMGITPELRNYISASLQEKVENTLHRLYQQGKFNEHND